MSPVDASVPVIAVAVDAASVERPVIEAWALDHEPHVAAVLDAVTGSGTGLGAALQEYDDALVVPVRVAWLPTVERRPGTSRLSELALLATPKRPATWLSRRLTALSPSRRRVIDGEPALLSELRKRFVNTSGDATDPDAFGAYVRRSAVVTLEREERALIGNRYKVPHAVSEEILARKEFRDEIADVASEMGLTADEGLEKAEECLDELVAVQSRAAVDMFYAMMEPLHSSTWKVLADESGLARLRELNKRYALVFLPAHRSYADTLVLGDVLARNDFPRNHVMGGANLRIWPISDLARRAGIVFIRRSFGDDEIYKSVVQEYFAFLLSKRFNLEWYFEGGRSRTGKIRSPRYGLLRYVAQAVQSGRVEDVYLVPTSITYDRLFEVSKMAAEQAGAKKQAEGLKWLAEYARSQRRTQGGSAHVRFGEPIAMRSWLPTAGASDDDNRAALHKIAFEVAVGINRTSPLTANGLLALTLLGVRDQSLTLTQIRQILRPVLAYIEARRLPSTGLELLSDADGLISVLADLVRAKVVTVFDKGEEPIYAIERGQHLVAAFYRNNAIHWFVNRAILELSLVWTSQQDSENPELTGWTEAKRIRDLLKFEFFFPDRDTFEQELREEMALLAPGATDPLEALRGSGVLMAHRVLRSFLDAQMVVADRLAHADPTQPIDKAAVLEDCDRVGQQMLLQRRLHSPESVSRELFTSAFDLKENFGLLAARHTESPEDLQRRRTHHLEYVTNLIERAQVIESLDAANRAEVTGVVV
ncbi:MAG: glycerol-3-phosphate 1-O-acyltransferase [Nocardioides sp.]